jgi:hypothetical protein
LISLGVFSIVFIYELKSLVMDAIDLLLLASTAFPTNPPSKVSFASPVKSGNSPSLFSETDKGELL